MYKFITILMLFTLSFTSADAQIFQRRKAPSQSSIRVNAYLETLKKLDQEREANNYYQNSTSNNDSTSTSTSSSSNNEVEALKKEIEQLKEQLNNKSTSSSPDGKQWVICNSCGGAGTCGYCNGTGQRFMSDRYVKCASCDRGVCFTCKGSRGRYE